MVLYWPVSRVFDDVKSFGQCVVSQGSRENLLKICELITTVFAYWEELRLTFKRHTNRGSVTNVNPKNVLDGILASFFIHFNVGYF